MVVGISINNLSKKYGKTKAVDNINAEFYENQVTILLGRNGAAKSGNDIPYSYFVVISTLLKQAYKIINSQSNCNKHTRQSSLEPMVDFTIFQ
jgi:ABC-type Mn2+/Zn2+ transport system ATPase subunit